MQKLLLTLTALAMATVLAGCAADNLHVPCPNFGAKCSKTPVNSWNYHQ